MPSSARGARKDFLSVLDFEPAELDRCLDLAEMAASRLRALDGIAVAEGPTLSLGLFMTAS